MDTTPATRRGPAALLHDTSVAGKVLLLGGLVVAVLVATTAYAIDRIAALGADQPRRATTRRAGTRRTGGVRTCSPTPSASGRVRVLGRSPTRGRTSPPARRWCSRSTSAARRRAT